MNQTSVSICFIGLGNLFSTPYLYRYLNNLDQRYDIIFWNRVGIEENCPASDRFGFDYPIDKVCSKSRKAIGYLGFRRYAKKILERKKYTKIVFLSGNCAVLLSDYILRHPEISYIVDIRDYFKEENRLYYFIEKTVISRSTISVISSPGYRAFLPAHNYLLAHNAPTFEDEQIVHFRESRKLNQGERKIVISYIGGVRFFSQDKKVLSFFANDKRYHIRYIGSGAKELQSYCDSECISNVELHDYFDPEETFSFYESTDMILNLYGNHTPLLDYALSNKLYYSAFLGLPILVCPDTYMEHISTSIGIGFVVDLEGDKLDTLNRLYDWFHSIDWDEVYSKCDVFRKQVLQDNEIFDLRIKEFFNEAD